MKKVKVQLVSIAPMLMNKRQMISEEAALAKKKSDVIDPKVDAEKRLTICIPELARHISTWSIK